jgi:hypothetical protein
VLDFRIQFLLDGTSVARVGRQGANQELPIFLRAAQSAVVYGHWDLHRWNGRRRGTAPIDGAKNTPLGFVCECLKQFRFIEIRLSQRQAAVFYGARITHDEPTIILNQIFKTDRNSAV